MQEDMHFYATYAIARLAGFEKNDANVIATSAQFVDDAVDKNSEKNERGELFMSICTAHHNVGAGATSLVHPQGHRLVWVPFHFYPGGKGNSLEERLLCTKDSAIVNEMFANHLSLHKKDFYLHLLGIATHVYMDTFSHYGFSGICSELNEVKYGSIEEKLDEEEDKSILGYIRQKKDDFYNFYDEYIAAEIGERGSRGLGHGGVATYPDRPYLPWRFEYEKPRYGNGTDSGIRDNPKTYLEGIEKLYAKFTEAAGNKYEDPNPLNFDERKDRIKYIINIKAEKQDRSDAWLNFIKEEFGDTPEYKEDGDEWNEQREKFSTARSPDNIGDCYRFHQAAYYHRWYTLKDLLPSHGIYAV